MTRDDIRNTASTLAHYWAVGHTRNPEGVRRIIMSHAAELRPVLGALVMRFLELRGEYVRAASFEALLFDMAGLEDEADDREAMRAMAELEQARS